MKYIVHLILLVSTISLMGIPLNTIEKFPLPLDKQLKDAYQQLELLHTFDTTHNTRIAILQNQKGKRFVIKQDLSNSLDKSLQCILRDTMGALLAQAVDIPTNDITIIPQAMSFIGKDRTERAATLHSFVPGTQINQLPKSLEQFRVSIHQVMKETISKQEWGLTYEIINNMATHPQLCKIAALDTFIANTDRNGKNYFYDKKRDSFYIIDFECGFRKNMAQHSCNNIATMLTNKSLLTTQAIHGLITYKNTLAKLVQQYPPSLINHYFIAFAQRMNISSEEQWKKVTHMIEQFNFMIESNYTSCQHLIALIDKLIEMQS